MHLRPGLGRLEQRRTNALASSVWGNSNVPQDRQVTPPFQHRLASTYGLLALLVASIGLYGVTAFSVAQRTREIGVRIALGSDRSRIVATVVRGPVGQTLVGLAIGVPLAFVASQLISTQPYGVGTEDPLVFGGATVVLLGSAAIAVTIPALRAASINPTQALQGD